MRYISTLCPLIAVLVSLMVPDPASADHFFGGCDNICGADACDDFSSQGKNRCNCSIPVWTVKADYVHLWRDRTGSDLVLFSEALYQGDIPLLYFSQLDFDDSGFDGSIIRSNGRGKGVEMRYLGVKDFTDAQTFEGNSHHFPGSSTVFGGTTEVGYKSGLQSLELLGYRQHDDLKLSFGFRLVGLKESLTYRYVGPLFAPSSRDYLFHNADNTLYGFQIGLDGPLWRKHRRFSVNGLAKAGFYLNDLEVSSAQNSSGSAQNSDCEAAFVGEVGLTGVYAIRYDLSLRAGYQMVFIDGVSLAADQSVNTSNLAIYGPATVSIDQNSLFYHGLNIGLEYRF